MTFKRRLMASIAFGWVLAASANAGTLAQDFVHPPADTRPMVRWWWFGPAVVPDELVREIKVMKQGGFGGFEIQPVYPLQLDDPAKGIKNLTYLSDDFQKAVTVASDTGRAEGMRVDITLGSGWPYGGPYIPATEASSKVMLSKVPVPANAIDVALPTPNAGERWIAAFLVDAATADGAAKAMQVTFDASGHVKVPAATGDRTLLVVMQGRTGQQVKRPGVGGEGFVLDHMSNTAVQHHLKVVADRLITAFGDHPPYAVFSDSLEVYGADWTDDLIPEFQKRRGYDLTPHLLQLFYDSADSAAVRHDWGQTLSELTDERYLTPINDWAK
ncbi:MAG TPA: glycosyl hydrolase, partial [Asticcacaulis sp.]|nr:glycosyl hydrolase [Asticcacaulis sp.]